MGWARFWATFSQTHLVTLMSIANVYVSNFDHADATVGFESPVTSL
jgi:hypothetical protein